MGSILPQEIHLKALPSYSWESLVLMNIEKALSAAIIALFLFSIGLSVLLIIMFYFIIQ